MDRTDLFENASIPKAVAKLCVPTVIGLLVVMIYSIADTYFVGMLNDSVQTAAVTLAAPVLLAFNAVSNLFGVGSSSVMSRALGVKDHDTIRQSSAFGFYCAATLAAMFSICATVFRGPLMNILGTDSVTFTATGDYLFWTVTLGAVPSILNVVLSNMVRAEGASVHASAGTMSGCLLNIILDPVFILPSCLNMGAAGAGCATFISNCAACLYFGIYLLRSKTHISLNIRHLFHLKREIPTAVFIVGIPAMIQNLLNVTGMTLLNNLTAPYGEAALSAMGIAHKTAMIAMYIGMGISQGIMPLIGYNYSSGNTGRMKHAIIYTAKLTVIIMVTISGLFILFPEQVISVFMKDPDVVAYGSKFLVAYCIAQPFLGIDFLGVGVFQACGMGSKALLFAVLRKIVFEIPLLLLLDRLYPLYGLPFSQTIAEFVLAIAAAFMLISIIRKLEAKKKELPV